MKVKLLELRDAGTFIPLLCVDMNPEMELTTDPVEGERRHANYAQRYLLRRCGYPCNGHPNVAITPLRADGSPCTNDPYHWGDRTYAVGHHHIINNWDALKDGDVVDVSYILGETKAPKVSERVSEAL